MTDPATHITVRIEPMTLVGDDVGEFIWAAIERLPIPADRISDVRHRSDDFIDRVRYAGFDAGFRLASLGRRGSAANILKAVDDIAAGLSQIERGLQVLDDARRSNAAAHVVRRDELERLQHGILRSVVDAVASRLPGHNLSDRLIAEAMPRHGIDWFKNSWNGAFSIAAARVDHLSEAASLEKLRAPKTPAEWRNNLIHLLADTFEALTGERAKAYRSSSNPDPDHRSPFCQFVADLWPIWFPAPAATPSDATIDRAMKKRKRPNSDRE